MEREQGDVLASAKSVCGVDLDWLGLKAHRGIQKKAFASACELPFTDESFDIVTANMVVEHLPVPSLAVDEAFRVLRPGGVFVFHTPNAQAWPTSLTRRVPARIKKALFSIFDGRPEEDVFETHYRMNTPADVRRFARGGGFEVEDVAMVSTGAAIATLGPAALPELLYIRWLRNSQRAEKRSNIISTLRKPTAVSIATVRDTVPLAWARQN
jgi:SAM-dependent methyltransferase